MEFTYNQIVHLNAELGEKGLAFHIHFKNSKVAGIEGYGACACDGKEELLIQTIREFFRKEGMEIEFTENRYMFSPVN
ncbi:MAG: hypothetical protein Q4G58_12835 [bacterium]|nr:hypothetical protein [bacterium]